MPDPVKPPLSDPMAEALAEDAAAARLKDTKTAEKTAAEAEGAKAAPEIPPTPADGAPATPTAEELAAAEAAKVAETAKPKRTPEDAMRTRIGNLTTRLTAEEAAKADLSRQLEAARALLAAQGKEIPPGDPLAAPVGANGEKLYTKAEIDAAAAALVATQRANETYEAGKDKFGDWDSRIDALKLQGVMSASMLDAAMATGAPTDVLHFLGGDLAEAERIGALSPVKMGVELGLLANKLTAPKDVRISKAPAPIDPVNGQVSPVIDMAKLADSDDMSAWVAARAKAGDPWAKGKQR